MYIYNLCKVIPLFFSRVHTVNLFIAFIFFSRTMIKLKVEQLKLNELENHFQLSVKSMTTLKSIQKSFDDLKKEKDTIEELYVVTKGTFHSFFFF